MHEDYESYAAEFETQLTLIDDNGVEQEFEVLATAEIREGIRCVCLAPVCDDQDEATELVILRLLENSGSEELTLAGLEDSQLLDEAYGTFVEMFRLAGMDPEKAD